MLRNSNRGRLHAIILLLVMLLQVGIKSFHVHHACASVSIECEDCEQHRVHDGHLISRDGQSDDCMLCQLLSNPYELSEVFHPDAVITALCSFDQVRQWPLCLGQWQSVRPRGPPSYLL